jgi:predicted PhzF superfamily epimerase YddE/YHI9
VGVVVDTELKINKDERQKMATESGFSEIVFINNIENREISIYSPQNEIPFAGHAVVGTAYFLSQEFNQKISQLKSMGGAIETWREGKLTWIRGDLSVLPNWNYEQLDSVELVEKLNVNETSNKEHTFVWAWIDKEKALIRARTFANDWGIPEDEANGSGSMRLTNTLKREITIIHGQGSVIHARPSKDNCAEVGGLVKLI